MKRARSFPLQVLHELRHGSWRLRLGTALMAAPFIAILVYLWVAEGFWTLLGVVAFWVLFFGCIRFGGWLVERS